MLTWLRKRFRGSDSSRPAKSVDQSLIYSQMRERALCTQREHVGIPFRPISSPAWGVLMETGYPHATATLFSLVDGNTSLYLSNGGGVIGAQSYEPVRKVAELLNEAANNLVPLFTHASTYPLPVTGEVRFFCLTDAGVLTASASSTELAGGRHPLSPLFFAAHSVLAELRALVKLSTTF